MRNKEYSSWFTICFLPNHQISNIMCHILSIEAVIEVIEYPQLSTFQRYHSLEDEKQNVFLFFREFPRHPLDNRSACDVLHEQACELSSERLVRMPSMLLRYDRLVMRNKREKLSKRYSWIFISILKIWFELLTVSISLLQVTIIGWEKKSLMKSHKPNIKFSRKREERGDAK